VIRSTIISSGATPKIATDYLERLQGNPTPAESELFYNVVITATLIGGNAFGPRPLPGQPLTLHEGKTTAHVASEILQVDRLMKSIWPTARHFSVSSIPRSDAHLTSKHMQESSKLAGMVAFVRNELLLDENHYFQVLNIQYLFSSRKTNVHLPWMAAGKTKRVWVLRDELYVCQGNAPRVHLNENGSRLLSEFLEKAFLGNGSEDMIQ
jgi:hypothetical protein